jgi:hypothetical protein
MRQKSAGALKEVVAELTLENRLLKKSVTADGGRHSEARLVHLLVLRL